MRLAIRFCDMKPKTLNSDSGTSSATTNISIEDIPFMLNLISHRLLRATCSYTSYSKCLVLLCESVPLHLCFKGISYFVDKYACNFC